jgi:uncharacterized protein YlxP (DUF503 family)
MDLQDKWTEAVIACAMVGNDTAHLQSTLESVRMWTEAHWTDGDVFDTKIELL